MPSDKGNACVFADIVALPIGVVGTGAAIVTGGIGAGCGAASVTGGIGVPLVVTKRAVMLVTTKPPSFVLMSSSNGTSNGGSAGQANPLTD